MEEILSDLSKGDFENAWWTFKNKYLTWILIGLFLLALTYGSNTVCTYLANGKCLINVK